ncbi:zinc-binding alcohol dehydrogenase [Grosmannia clavigera kw1407]|uniref:alcohol dehydrogenase (NADP(+)) n=1 Tax=Grosmannia clavigera (strain kw1407 / UAMH 11150) TaxID=655863 RepID=F0XCU5_GROCL|nr:zinc-binding alcohol dehydrogenase [Grosmannia clavigera kw1407]EFX03836.1 zinc-binding alcohol dehydrogenase [Grosmannia clavigera kw1407]
MSAATDYTFQGWVALDKNSTGNLEWQTFEPKAWEETDVDIKITHCGICGSDLHTLRSGWGPTKYPCVVGHEIVGTAVRVGSEVKHIKVGDRVGVGAQADSCRNRKGSCRACSTGRENLCGTHVGTYNSVFYNGGKSYGGYADYNRSPGHFVIPIPDGVTSSNAASMMCGGVTVFTPLKNSGCGPGKRVGVIGVGGLGHFAILWAKAMGADRVVGISRRNDKRADVLKLGADEYIAVAEEADWAKTHASSLDIIVCTVASTDMPLREYLALLDIDGRFVQVGIPEGLMPPIAATDLVLKNVSIGGGMIGSPADIRDMLQLAVDKNVQPWIEERPMDEVNQAILDMDKGLARYRYTLVNEKHL